MDGHLNIGQTIKNKDSVIQAGRNLILISPTLINQASKNYREGSVCFGDCVSSTSFDPSDFIENVNGELKFNYDAMLRASTDEVVPPPRNSEYSTDSFVSIEDSSQYSKITAGTNLYTSVQTLINEGGTRQSHTVGQAESITAPGLQSVGLGAVLTPTLPDATDLANGSLYQSIRLPLRLSLLVKRWFLFH